MSIWRFFFVSNLYNIRYYFEHFNSYKHRELTSVIPQKMILFLDTELECKQCDAVLQEMENIDDEAEAAGNFMDYLLTFGNVKRI